MRFTIPAILALLATAVLGKGDESNSQALGKPQVGLPPENGLDNHGDNFGLLTPLPKPLWEDPSLSNYKQTDVLDSREVQGIGRDLAAVCRSALAVLDRSGSQAALFTQTRAALSEVVNELFNQSPSKLPIVGVFSFSVYGQSNVVPTTSLPQLTQGIDGIAFSGGGTRLYTALQLVYNQLQANPSLVSDTVLVIPIISDFVDEKPAELLALVEAIRALAPGKIQFMPIGVRSDSPVNTALMEQIEPNPNYRKFFPTPAGLLADATNVAAQICSDQAPVITNAPVTSAPVTSAPVTRGPTRMPVTGAPVMGAPVTETPTSSPAIEVVPPVVPPEVAVPIALAALAALALLLCCRKQTVQDEPAPKEVDVEANAIPSAFKSNPIATGEFKAAKPNVIREKEEDLHQGAGERINQPNKYEGFWTGGGNYNAPKGQQRKFGDEQGVFNPGEEEKQDEPSLSRMSETTQPPASPAKKIEYKVGPLAFIVAGMDLFGVDKELRARKILAKPELDVTSVVTAFSSKKKSPDNH